MKKVWGGRPAFSKDFLKNRQNAEKISTMCSARRNRLRSEQTVKCNQISGGSNFCGEPPAPTARHFSTLHGHFSLTDIVIVDITKLFGALRAHTGCRKAVSNNFLSETTPCRHLVSDVKLVCTAGRHCFVSITN